MGNLSQPQRSLQTRARLKHESRKFVSRLNDRYERSATVLSGVSAGKNLVQVNGQYYPAEGIDGQGGALAVVNIGTPAVARYAPPNNRSVLAVAGTGLGGGGGGGGGGSNTLDGLADVSLASLADGNILQYDASITKWINVVPSGGVGGINLNALTDVTLTSTAGGQTLVYNSSAAQWVNELLPWNSINFSGSNLTDIVTRPHSALTGITPDQHHFRVHDIITGDALGPVHTITGADFTVVGVHPTNTLALLPTSSSPGAAQSVLRTDTSGGLQLDTNLLYVDAVNNRIGINRTPGNAALDLLAAANADHTQRIKMKSGQTGRLWRIEDLAGNELIILDSVGDLQSGQPGFVSGLTGWQITPNGNAEFNNIWARGELHATVFVKDEVHATGGTFFVATAGTLHDDAVIDNSTATIENFQATHKPGSSQVTDDLTIETTASAFSGTTLAFQSLIDFINVNDPPSGPGFYFNGGDTIRSKTEVETGVTDFWLTVNAAQQLDGYARYSVYKRSGTNGILPKGAALVSYGQVGAGRILMTSDLNYAPYLDVFTVGPNVWTGAAGAVVPRVRLGRLDGVGVPGVSGVEQYGMVAGTDLSNANAPYFIASNLQFKLYKINITLNDGTNDTASLSADGNLTLGTNIGVTAGKSFQVLTTGTDKGDVIVGQKGVGNYLWWDQSAGLLNINGSLQIGSTDAKTYIDNQDTAVTGAAAADATTKANLAQSNAAADATAKANAAQIDAQNYANSWRLEGVNGTFTVTGQQSVMWTSVSLRFADSTGISLNNSAASPGLTGLTVRTWLYYNGSTTMQTTTDLTGIGPNTAVVAVFDPGASAGNPGSLKVIGGSTYISGNNIVTGSIVASNIQANAIIASHIVAGAVTAAKISVSTLSAIQVMTGGLTVSGNLVMGQSGTNFGALYSFGKSDFTQNAAGFFLGWDTNSTSAYKFAVGDANSWLKWDGAAINLQTTQPITIVSASGAGAINVQDTLGHLAQLVFGYDSVNTIAYLTIDSMRANIEMRTPKIYVGDGTVGLSLVDFIVFRALGSTNALQYKNDGTLNYNGPFTVANNPITAGGQLITAGNSIRIATEKTGLTNSSSSPGSVGEIAWAQGFIYVYTGPANGWRRAILNSF